jgi:hypothetical protein
MTYIFTNLNASPIYFYLRDLNQIAILSVGINYEVFYLNSDKNTVLIEI